MMVYTEEAATKDECLKKISRRHSLDAGSFADQVKIIRIHRMTRAGFLGLFKRDLVEITYSFAPRIPVRSITPPPEQITARTAPLPSFSRTASAPDLRPAVSPSAQPVRSFDENRRRILDNVLQDYPEMKQKISVHAGAGKRGTVSARENASGKDAQLDLLTEEDFAAAEKPADGKTPASPAESGSVPPGGWDALLESVRKIEQRMDLETGISRDGGEENGNLAKIREILEHNDFSPSFLQDIEKRIRMDLTLEALSDFPYLQRRVLSWIGSAVRTAPEHSIMRPHLITLVGPTGVGKTTTVAKLAAAYLRAYKKTRRPLNVRIITIDNYRIGAKEHLERYGEIMGVPISSAENPQDLQKLVSFYRDADIILIDTAGRNPKDHGELANMRAFFDGLHDNCETLLTVSACTKSSDLRDIIRQYGVFEPDGLIITKFDETTRVGNIISVLADENLPVSYITTGQRVPRDFEPASVMKFLLALEGFSINLFSLEEEFPVPENRFEWS